MNRVDAIIEFCLDSEIEIVAYGLAPNPFGFTYELFGDACSDEAHALDDMLGRLTAAEVTELRRRIFGGEK